MLMFKTYERDRGYVSAHAETIQKMDNKRKEWQKNNDLLTSENENYESINSLTTNALNLAQKNGNNKFQV